MPRLTELAGQAYKGDRTACAAFLRTFLQSELVIPDREQPQKLAVSIAPSSPFFPFLAFESEGETFIPVFEQEEQIASWTGTPLSYRRYAGKQLFTLMPSGWWVIFNPGSEVEKLFSPWEIDLLRGGSEEAISEVVAEHFDSSSDEFIDARTIEPREHPELFEALSRFCHTVSSVLAAWVLELTPITDENPSAREFVIGLMITSSAEAGSRNAEAAATQTTPLRLDLERRLGPLLIGWGTLRTAVVIEGDETVIGALLASHVPAYRRPNL